MIQFAGEARLRVEPTGRLTLPVVLAGEAPIYIEPSGRLRTPTEDIRNPSMKIERDESKMVIR